MRKFRIPSLIHQMWLDKKDPSSKKFPSQNEETIESMIVNNPNMEYHLWNVNEVRQLLSNDEELKKYLPVFEKIQPWISKCDFARMCVVYAYGGIYTDLDIYCHKSFENVLDFLK